MTTMITWSSSLFPWLVGLCSLALFINFLSKKNSSKQLPPGPPGLPVVGNIFGLGSELPHETFYELQAKYGPVLWLKFGFINTMVINSAETATELFKKCDQPFADRSVPDALTALGFDKGSIAMGRYGDYWRRMRRLCTTEFLVGKKANESLNVRKKCISGMIEWIKEDMEKSKQNGGSCVIKLNKYLSGTTLNIVGILMLSKQIVTGAESEKGAGEFYDAFVLLLEWMGKPNMVDFFPFLKWIDPQRIRKMSGKYLGILVKYTSEIVEERIRERQKGKERKNDFLDAMLDDEDGEGSDDKLTVDKIVIIILEMFFGGTGTTSSTIEWGMTELLRHSSAMKRLQNEIDQVVGHTRLVEESDLVNMPYLHAVVKETLRLYPPGPLLLPRNAMKDTEFMGYVVPKNTQVHVNAWAIHRDPAVWVDPMSFKPERFLDSDIDFKGQHFQLIPFGSGRRICLGLQLGHKTATLAIASLVQSFDWKLEDGVKPETLDMRGMLGIVLHKLVPLRAIPTLRE